MTLSDYPPDELRVLQFAIAIAYEESKLEDLRIWADRIEEAIKDATFEEENLFL